MNPYEFFNLKADDMYRKHTHIPGWAKAEQLERSHSLIEIWKFGDSILPTGGNHASGHTKLSALISKILTFFR